MDVLVRFEDLPWESPTLGLRFKAFTRGAQRLRLLEFEPGFVEPDWCAKGHALQVLEGSFTLRLQDREVRLKAGDVGFLAAGEDAHKVILGPTERARVLLFEVL